MNRQGERTEVLIGGEQHDVTQRSCISTGAYCCLITSAILLASAATVDIVDAALDVKNIDPGLKLGMNAAFGVIAGITGLIGAVKVVSEKKHTIERCISHLFGCNTNNGAPVHANPQVQPDDGLDVEAGSHHSALSESKH